MGLFGVGKLLVLVLIIGAVWYGFKYFARRNQIGSQQNNKHLGEDKNHARNNTTQDMESCSVCGTFVPNTSAKNCGRESCPYPE